MLRHPATAAGRGTDGTGGPPEMVGWVVGVDISFHLTIPSERDVVGTLQGLRPMGENG